MDMHQIHQSHPVHPSQRRVSCELCRRNKAKCQRVQPEDSKCLRCTLNNLLCDAGEQRKVGRPKRKEAASSPAAKGAPSAKRRQKQSDHPQSTSTNTDRINYQLQSLPSTLPVVSNECESSAQIPTAGHIPSHPHTGVHSLASASVSRTPDSEWLEFPTFMTDRWCHEGMHGATRGGIIIDAEFAFPWNASAARSSGTTLRINPELPINPPLRSMYSLARRKRILPFGIGRPPTYYVHENKFSSDPPSDATTSNIGIDSMRAMTKLTRIVQGLRLRSAMVQTNKTLLSLNLLVHREGPFFLESYSLCEYVMTATQELEQIAATLLCGPRSNRKSDEHLSACLISTTTDLYCHILAFFQLFLEHLTDRAERQGDDPVIPIPGLTFNGILLAGPCTQGVLFSSSSFYLLGRLEIVLGLNPMSGGTGLLSTNQIDVLCDKLDRSKDLTQRKGIMRPADVRKLYARVAAVLEQLSAKER